MLKKFLILLALISPLRSSIVSMNSNDFCQSFEEECSRQNAPHIYSCGPGVCGRNQTECIEYLRQEIGLKRSHFSFFNSLTNFFANIKAKRSENNFMRFKSAIKGCPQTEHETAYESQPSDICKRAHCFQYQLKFVKTKLFFYIQKKKVLKQIDCPCPELKPHQCVSGQHKYCSLSKETCDSFRYTNKKMNSTAELVGVKNCGQSYILIE